MEDVQLGNLGVFSDVEDLSSGRSMSPKGLLGPRWWVLLGEGKPMDFQGEEGKDEVLKVERGVFCSKKISGGKSWETALSFKLSFFQH